ncbi:hypothetical protein B4099_3543 [Heyndrickxia coagulans]|uniref:Uncharacterized protein n=1 Tax=Heyndrickxia coagulans TaxID=1398 RepID=A0A150JS42_HEYCO|nr:hypothetical protein B4099_3543 [Heyndrickxia coagulans]
MGTFFCSFLQRGYHKICGFEQSGEANAAALSGKKQNESLFMQIFKNKSF